MADEIDDFQIDNRPINNTIPNCAHVDDVIKIMLSTDNHIGYNEKDQVRGDDSLIAFEEMLQFAQKHDVDMILLGGDLFHENKPSRRMMTSTIDLLRKYCMGDKPCQLEYVSDPTENFKHCKFQTVNYEDENLNIAYPVFSIHGNHDDPSIGNLCALDVLSSAGLVNYFGKCNRVDKVEVAPILLRKGQTKLAVFGMGSIRDERLHRIFLEKNVSILRPRQDPDSWFNLFAIHQNRVKHAAKDYIPESFLGEFLDLVLWGHEHDCRIDPEYNGNFFVTQPGSSVATSLGEGESKQKHVGLLKVYKKNFTLTKLRLKTVRQFYFEDVVLSSTGIKPDIDSEKKVRKYLEGRIERLIERAKEEHTGHRKQPKLPLIRLRVDHSGGFDSFSSVQFGQQFVDRVANPKDIILFTKKRQQREKGEILDLADADAQVSETMHATVEELVTEFLSATSAKGDLKLQVLSETGLGKALSAFVQKDDNDAIKSIVKKQTTVTDQHLKERCLQQVDDIPDWIRRFRESRTKKDVEQEAEQTLQASMSQRAYRPPADSDQSDLSDAEPMPERPARGRGSRSGRGSRGGAMTRGSARGRGGRGRGSGGKKQSAAIRLDGSDDDVSIVPGTPSGASGNTISDFFDAVPKRKAVKRAAKGILEDSDDDDDCYIPGKRRPR